MINCLQNPFASVLIDKWRFDLSQYSETLALDYGGFSMDDIADKTLRALGFHLFAIEYLEEGSSRFTDVTDLELTAEPAVVDNPSQVVTDLEKEVLKKKNKQSGLQNFVLLLDFFRLLVLNLPFFCHLILCPLLCPLFFLVLDPLLFRCLIVCALRLLFLVAEFQLLCHYFLCSVHLFFYNQLNLVTTTRLRQRKDAQHEQKKL